MTAESYTILDNEIWEDRNLSHTEFRVLSYLIGTYSLKDGYSFPKRETIAEKCKVHKDTLNKVLNSLEAKGYITRATNPHKGGRNNIYYIHKYLVVSKKGVAESDTQEAPADKKADVKNKHIREELSTNELLVKERVHLRSKMTDLIREQLNELDTDILIKAIDRANSYKPEGYYIGYLLNVYDSVKNIKSEPPREAQDNKPSNNSSSNRKDNRGANTKPLTRYHGTFNEHFRNYSEDELEAKLLKAQAEKRKGLAQWEKQNNKYTTKQEKW